MYDALSGAHPKYPSEFVAKQDLFLDAFDAFVAFDVPGAADTAASFAEWGWSRVAAAIANAIPMAQDLPLVVRARLAEALARCGDIEVAEEHLARMGKVSEDDYQVRGRAHLVRAAIAERGGNTALAEAERNQARSLGYQCDATGAFFSSERASVEALFRDVPVGSDRARVRDALLSLGRHVGLVPKSAAIWWSEEEHHVAFDADGNLVGTVRLHVDRQIDRGTLQTAFVENGLALQANEPSSTARSYAATVTSRSKETDLERLLDAFAALKRHGLVAIPCVAHT